MNTTPEPTLGTSSESIFSNGIHICHIYNSDLERTKTMGGFLMRALSEGNKILRIVDRISPHELKAELISLGVESEIIDRSLLEVDNETAYNPDGNFDPDTVLKNIGHFVTQAHQDGYSGLHVTGDMAWVLRDKIRSSLLMEYETKVLDYQKLTPCTAICEYDARIFDGDIIMDILAVHPVILVRGQIVKNPYYIPPREFLAQYNARQSQ